MIVVGLVVVIVLLLVASLMLALAKSAALGDRAVEPELEVGAPCPIVPLELARRRRANNHPWRAA